MAAATLYDRTSRYLVRCRPAELLAWLLGLPPDGLRFVRWLDAHLGTPDTATRTADTLAHLTNPADGGRPWSVLVEWQTRPDPEMFGRALEYLGAAWRLARPTDHPGDRFALGLVVVNLTGRGNSLPRTEWPEAGLSSGLGGREWNLAALDASALVNQAASGMAPVLALPWVPLMIRGGETDIIQRWLEVARAQPDARVRADLGLVLVFAELAGCAPAWKQALEGWNMQESAWLKEVEFDALQRGLATGRSAGKVEGQVEFILRFLTNRFGNAPEGLGQFLKHPENAEKLSAWLDVAMASPSLEAFQQAVGFSAA